MPWLKVCAGAGAASVRTTVMVELLTAAVLLLGRPRSWRVEYSSGGEIAAVAGDVVGDLAERRQHVQHLVVAEHLVRHGDRDGSHHPAGGSPDRRGDAVDRR